jgi:hypothetical protein
MGAIGRNERCPCNSGKKFKKCCLLSASWEDKTHPATAEMLKKRVKSNLLGANKETVWIQDLQGERKMSEVILEFVGPLMREDDSFETSEKLITMAMIAWNLGLDDETESKVKFDSLFNELRRTMDEDLAIEFLKQVALLVARKHEYFSEVNRIVLDWHLTNTSQGPHLDVVSTFKNNDQDTKKVQTDLSLPMGAKRLSTVLFKKLNQVLNFF